MLVWDCADVFKLNDLVHFPFTWDEMQTHISWPWFSVCIPIFSLKIGYFCMLTTKNFWNFLIFYLQWISKFDLSCLYYGYNYTTGQNSEYIYCKLLYFLHLSHLMTKPTKWHVHLAKTQISLGIHPVWSESSLSAWKKLGSLVTHWAYSEDSDQTGRMPRLIWVFAERTVILLVLSWGSSFCDCQLLPEDYNYFAMQDVSLCKIYTCK